jgi:MinD-like ATPase involved in chromosome partitioning or flagellar assembly
MEAGEDESGERTTADGSPVATEGAAPVSERVTTPGAAGAASESPSTTAGPEGAGSAEVGSAEAGSASEEDLAAETTRRVDTESAARGDVRRPGSADTRWTPSGPGPSPAPSAAQVTSAASEQQPPAAPSRSAYAPSGPSASGQQAPGPSSGEPGGPGSGGEGRHGEPTGSDSSAPSAELATIGPPTGPPALSALSSAQLLRPAKPVPRTGWRRAVYVASGGVVNPGESEADAARRALVARVNQPLQGCYKIAMLSLKGGVGKTTTTAALGATFASLRGDRVVAVDANPDRGTLAEKVPVETTATVRHLLRDVALVRRYSDVRAYTSQGPSRLEVLASEQDPAVSEAFSELDYRRAVDLLEHFYNIVLTDCGTGLMHSAMRGVLDVADSLVVVSSSSIDGARSASATLDWLDAHGYGDLVARSTAVINYVRRSSGGVDLDRVAEHFAARCRTVARLPFDPHLDEGAEIELEKLAPRTRTAMLELAAVVADDFPRASRVRIGPR